MQLFRLILLLVGTLQIAGSCRKSSNVDRARPPEISISSESTADEAPDVAAATSSWQQILVLIPNSPISDLDPADAGFEKVMAVFSKDVYGPCTHCHATEWPYISKLGLPRLRDSLNLISHGNIRTIADLGSYIISCVDQAAEEYCAGDINDASDNIDSKMPSKFGYDSVNGEDLLVLRQWFSKERRTVSPTGGYGTNLASLASFEIASPLPNGIEVREYSGTLTPWKNGVQGTIEVRLSGKCVEKSLVMELLDAVGKAHASARVILRCRDQILIPESQLMND